MDIGLIPPDKVGILEAAAAGSFLALLLQGKLDWRIAITIIACGLIFAYFFTVPIASLISKDANFQGPIGLMIGLVGMQICTGLLIVARAFATDPWGTLARLPFIGRFFGTQER